MTRAIGIITTTVPMIVATGTTIKVVEATFKRGGKPVGSVHYHFKGKKASKHRHEGGHISHEHRGLRGYGKTRKSLKRF